jgi:hypothetical protein
MTSVPLKYIPKKLSRKDRKIVSRELKKSRRLYKQGKYHTRQKVKSYPHRTSKHVLKAQKIFKISNMIPSKSLARKTGCSISALRAIVRKGEGAYYSAGSRPNQTAHSWGYARLASSLTGGKAAVVDWSILEKGCKHSGKTYKLGLKAKRIKRRSSRKTKI